jgi:pimeloyl-ACP methyl ester carboxylesterase
VTTFVLVHGAWQGGWVWQRVAPLLRAAGHDVHTPTLTGLGERAHLLHAEVGLDTHVRDVVGVLDFEDLSEVVLVGTSYGGAVITAVADSAAARLSRLIFIDGFLPGDGQSVFDLMPPAFPDAFRTAARQHGDGWRIPAGEELLDLWGVGAPADRAWLGPRLSDFPLRCFEQPAKLPTDGASAVPRTYIACTAYPAAAAFGPFVDRARTEGWEVAELPTGHVPMVTMPQELSALLCEAAAGPR